MEQTKEITKYVVFRESLLQSIVSDLITFGMLVFSVWFSSGSKLWSFICVIMFFTFISARAVKRSKTKAVFSSASKLKEWVDSEIKV